MNWQSFASQQFLYKRTGPTNYIKHLQTNSNACLLSTSILGWDWNVFPSIIIKSCHCPCHELWLKFKVQDARWRTARIALTKDTRHGLGNLSMSYLHSKPTASLGGLPSTNGRCRGSLQWCAMGVSLKMCVFLETCRTFLFLSTHCGLHKGHNLHMVKKH